MSDPAQSPLSLRPWPTGDKRPKSLAEFIARVKSAGPEGFRGISEDELRKEVELETAGIASTETAAADGDVEMESGPADGDESTTAVTADTIRTARDEALRNIDMAHQNAMLTLDFVSLLLTKEDPTNAGRTLSPTLRELVGIGTLGADQLAAPQTNVSRVQDNKMVATGWKFLDINRSMDSVLSAAARLQKEISLETRYWADVLAVSEKGWSVSRLPYERQTLGVKFGFSESAPEFRNTSLAPMRRSDDGAVSLDAARVANPQRVRVSIERDGVVVGRAMLPQTPAPDAPLESRVMEARNTIFHQELWYEINREGRTLLSFGVRLADGAVSYELDKHTKAVIRLCDLTDDAPAELGWGAGPDDMLAEAISSALPLLLSYAHRLNLRVRSQPGPPQVRQSRAGQPYALLRPVIAYLEHERSLERATRFVSDLTWVLQSAGYLSASFTLIEPPVSTASPGSSRHASSSEALLHTFLSPHEFQLQLSITPAVRLSVIGTTLSVIGTTQLSARLCTMYSTRLLPPLGEVPPGPGEPLPQQNTLRFIYPPSEIYPNLREVTHYIRGAVARFLADQAEQLAFSVAGPIEGDAEQRLDFVKSIDGTAVSAVEPDKRSVRFEVNLVGSNGEAVGVDEYGSPQLRVYGVWPPLRDGEELTPQTWIWTVEEAKGGIGKETVEGVCISIFRGLDY
ncbi:hypothetical protein GGTG_11444 [Gaeumannomyces tritici R3-111a-1]|uniref:Mediator of RNA polymerase II transcription subunit 17 n=1 Tax=Gaeumannomyces tritici (strain R3-111a-1) TaxID=644352 RepID=J3PD75_GAET3|nr:hypothetical protein GGTG_11444 [Gaeumannomyces tritici R3-111a-1]EJT70420.1 hypothetical protein GGTG_11444 [Gaeumannomyces tritici R3-111a-1]